MRIRSVSERARASLLAMALALSCLPLSNAVRADSPEIDTDAVQTARETTESLINALLAAVLDITSRTTAENVVPNSQAISLLLPHARPAYRLLDITGEPIDPRNRPRGRAEREAAERAAQGESTEILRRRALKTYVPLPLAVENCVACHDNYAGLELGTIVGVIAVKAPLSVFDDDDD